MAGKKLTDERMTYLFSESTMSDKEVSSWIIYELELKRRDWPEGDDGWREFCDAVGEYARTLYQEKYQLTK
jgi:hypothetical protein